MTFRGHIGIPDWKKWVSNNWVRDRWSAIRSYFLLAYLSVFTIANLKRENWKFSNLTCSTKNWKFCPHPWTPREQIMPTPVSYRLRENWFSQATAKVEEVVWTFGRALLPTGGGPNQRPYPISSIPRLRKCFLLWKQTRSTMHQTGLIWALEAWIYMVWI